MQEGKVAGDIRMGLAAESLGRFRRLLREAEAQRVAFFNEISYSLASLCQGCGFTSVSRGQSTVLDRPGPSLRVHLPTLLDAALWERI